MNAAAPAPESLSPPTQGAGRGLVIAASISSAVLASGLSLAVQFYSTKWQEQRATRISEVSKFVESSQQFDSLVTKFMTPFLKGEDTRLQQQAIRDNIQSQYNLLETARANLEPAQSARAKEYEDSLARVGEELDRGLPALKAKALVQAIADTRVQNVCVVFDLRKEADLPVIASDSQPCAEDLKRFSGVREQTAGS